MSARLHLENLHSKEVKLAHQIRQAHLHHLSDAELNDLKKQRLALKDEINKLLMYSPASQAA